MSMKKTFFCKVMISAFAVLMSLQVATAAEHKVASIADLLKIETLAAGDSVFFEGDVVVEAAFQTLAVLVDPEGTASISTSIPSLSSKWLDPKLMPGDVIEKYHAAVVIKDGVTSLNPGKPWGDGTSLNGYNFPHIEYAGTEPYESKIIRTVTVKELVENQSAYLNLPLAIDKAEIKVADFIATLCYRTETEELVESDIKLQVGGMSAADIPSEAAISLAILKPGSLLTDKLYLRAGYVADLANLKTIYKSDAQTTEAVIRDMPAVITHVETFKGKTYYAICPEKSHSTTASNSTRMTFATEPDAPFAVGDRIKITDPKAQYRSYYFDNTYLEYTPSSLVLSDEAVVTKESNSDVDFVTVDLSDMIKFQSVYEYRPIAVNGTITLRGTSSANKDKEFGITNAWLECNDTRKAVLVDTTLLADKSLREFRMNAVVYYPACLEGVDDGKLVLVPNSADDFIDNDVPFATIKELENLEMLDIQLAKLTGKLNVDAIYTAPKDDFTSFSGAMRAPGNTSATRVLVSDATGKMILAFNTENNLSFMVGDSITGIKGKFTMGDDAASSYLEVVNIDDAQVAYSTMKEPEYTEITTVNANLPITKPLILKDVYIHLSEDDGVTAFVDNSATAGEPLIFLSQARYPYGKKSTIKGFFDGETFYTTEITSTEAATVAELKAMASVKNLKYTGSLTFYSAPLASGLNTNDCVVFDETGFIRIRSYAWMSMANMPKAGDKITFTGDEEISFTNTADNAATIEIQFAQQLNVVAEGQALRTVNTVTLQQLLTDSEKAFNSDFVRLENVSTSFAVDFLDPFSPAKLYAVENEDTVAIVIGTNFNIPTGIPSKLNMNAIVDYKQGNPVLSIISMDEYTTPLEFNSIGGMKVYNNNQENVAVKFNALVIDAQEDKDGALYRVQRSEDGNNTFALAIRTSGKPKFAVGDSITVDFKNASMEAFSFTEDFESPKNIMTSLTIKGGEDRSVKVSDGNAVTATFVDMSFVGSFVFQGSDNRYIVTNKGTFITDNAEYNALGCVGYQISEFSTLLVADSYYEAAGKPESGIVSGILGAYIAKDGTSVAAIMPRSAADFLKENMTFDNIDAMVKAGEAPSSDITYTLVNPMVVTGVTSYTSGFGAQYDVVFVADETDAMTLMFMKELGTQYKLGDAIKGVSGKFHNAQATDFELEMPYGYGYTFDISSLDGIEKAETEFKPVAEVVTIAKLYDDVNYSGQLVTLNNVTRNGDTLTQGSETIPFDINGLEMEEDKAHAVTGIFYLNGEKTAFMPRVQDDIVLGTDVKDAVLDNTMFVNNGVIYANGAEISVYDITGRKLIDKAHDTANIAQYPQSVFVVKTVYADGSSFITKIVK